MLRHNVCSTNHHTKPTSSSDDDLQSCRWYWWWSSKRRSELATWLYNMSGIHICTYFHISQQSIIIITITISFFFLSSIRYSKKKLVVTFFRWSFTIPSAYHHHRSLSWLVCFSRDAFRFDMSSSILGWLLYIIENGTRFAAFIIDHFIF